MVECKELIWRECLKKMGFYLFFLIFEKTTKWRLASFPLLGYGGYISHKLSHSVNPDIVIFKL